MEINSHLFNSLPGSIDNKNKIPNTCNLSSMLNQPLVADVFVFFRKFET